MNAEPLVAVRVWDLPTRLFHWLLALCVVGSVVSAKIGGAAMDWHLRLGYAAFTLLAFRLLWGLVGGRWSRFASFVVGPGTLWRYLRGGLRAEEHHGVGHSPTGALSVLAMLAVLAAQVATGLVADDEIATTGPLVRFVSGAVVSSATGWHKGWGQWLILGLVALHVLAIVVYRLRRVDLIGPMLVGDKRLPPGTPATLDSGRTRLLALALAAACAAGVAAVVALGA